MPMPLNSCAGGLLATALLTLLLLPAQYYLPELAPASAAGPAAAAAAAAREQACALGTLGTLGTLGALNAASVALNGLALPTLDLALTGALLVLAAFTYLCEWIQRKLMERRIIKLNQYLGASVERLRAWDAQQEQLEATLKMVHNATAEYNLLLYLMLRQRRALPLPTLPPQPCFLDKEFDEPFPRSPTVEA